jgi:tetratricopeptide (TPR) repeat protein
MCRRLCMAVALWLALAASPAFAQAAASILPADVQAAIDAKDWQKAEDLLAPLIAQAPRWAYYEALGKAQLNLRQDADAALSYQRAVEMARREPAAKSAIGRLLIGEGNTQLRLHDTAAAIDLYRQAAALDPNPAVAYFNLCATEYNSGATAGALADCDKAIAVDPGKADAYFIKGSLLFADGKLVDGKWVGPPGASEALGKYLALAPDGAHASDVKQMLDMLK